MYAIISPIETWRETAPLLLSQILLQCDLTVPFSSAFPDALSETQRCIDRCDLLL